MGAVCHTHPESHSTRQLQDLATRLLHQILEPSDMGFQRDLEHVMMRALRDYTEQRIEQKRLRKKREEQWIN